MWGGVPNAIILLIATSARAASPNGIRIFPQRNQQAQLRIPVDIKMDNIPVCRSGRTLWLTINA